MSLTLPPSPTFALREVGLEERSEEAKQELQLALTQSQKPVPFPNVPGSPTGLEEEGHNAYEVIFESVKAALGELDPALEAALQKVHIQEENPVLPLSTSSSKIFAHIPLHGSDLFPVQKENAKPKLYLALRRPLKREEHARGRVDLILVFLPGTNPLVKGFKPSFEFPWPAKIKKENSIEGIPTLHDQRPRELFETTLRAIHKMMVQYRQAVADQKGALRGDSRALAKATISQLDKTLKNIDSREDADRVVETVLKKLRVASAAKRELRGHLAKFRGHQEVWTKELAQDPRFQLLDQEAIKKILLSSGWVQGKRQPGGLRPDLNDDLGIRFYKKPVAEALREYLTNDSSIREVSSRELHNHFQRDYPRLTEARVEGILKKQGWEESKRKGEDGTRATAFYKPHPTGLEELSEKAKVLDRKIREVAIQDSVLEWLDPLNIDLDDPSMRFAIHLGTDVSGSSSPPALTHLYTKVLDLKGIRIVSIPLDTPIKELQERLEQIREHPKVIMITSTEPHKVEVAKTVQDWGLHPQDVPPEVSLLPRNNALLLRSEAGVLEKVELTNSDGPSFVTQFKKVWGREGDKEGTFGGKKVVILGGWGGLGQALTISILNERPKELVISEVNTKEKSNLDRARGELPVAYKEFSKGRKRVPSPILLNAADLEGDEKLHQHLREAHIIINATGLGMNEDDKRSPVKDPTIFHRENPEELIVIDSIYRTKPGEPRPVSPFLRQAWDQGVRRVHNGLGLYARDFAWEGAWASRHLAGRILDGKAQEEIFQKMYTYAKEKRKLKEALGVLSTGLGEDNILGYRTRLEAMDDKELAALAREEMQALTAEERLAALGEKTDWLNNLVETLEERKEPPTDPSGDQVRGKVVSALVAVWTAKQASKARADIFDRMGALGLPAYGAQSSAGLEEGIKAEVEAPPLGSIERKLIIQAWHFLANSPYHIDLNQHFKRETWDGPATPPGHVVWAGITDPKAAAEVVQAIAAEARRRIDQGEFTHPFGRPYDAFVAWARRQYENPKAVPARGNDMAEGQSQMMWDLESKDRAYSAIRRFLVAQQAHDASGGAGLAPAVERELFGMFLDTIRKILRYLGDMKQDGSFGGENGLYPPHPIEEPLRLHARPLIGLIEQHLHLRTAGLEELTPKAQQLDDKIREAAAQLTWLKKFLEESHLTLDDPLLRFAIHLGGNVAGSSSPPSLAYLYKEVVDLKGIRLISIPLNTTPEELRERLEAIREHPRVILVTSTEPHKPEVARIVRSWGLHEEEANHPIEPTNNALLLRDETGIAKKTALTNSDGIGFVTQFKKVWGRIGEEEGSFKGKKVVILGGWGGLGQALSDAILREGPRQLVISEKVNLEKAQDELPALVKKLGLDQAIQVTILPSESPSDSNRDHPELLKYLREADVIVNATGLGMNKDDNRSPIHDPSVFKRGTGQPLVVIDSIYRTKPGEPRPVTPFIQQAWDQGVREVYNGLGLYVRDFAFEGAWVARTLTGQVLDEQAQEAIYKKMYDYARNKRNLTGALEGEYLNFLIERMNAPWDATFEEDPKHPWAAINEFQKFAETHPHAIDESHLLAIINGPLKRADDGGWLKLVFDAFSFAAQKNSQAVTGDVYRILLRRIQEEPRGRWQRWADLRTLEGALAAHSEIGELLEQVAEGIFQCLSDPDLNTQWAALDACTRAIEANPALLEPGRVPQLIPLLFSSDLTVRANAEEDLKRIASANPGVFYPSLLASLSPYFNDDDELIRSRVWDVGKMFHELRRTLKALPRISGHPRSEQTYLPGGTSGLPALPDSLGEKPAGLEETTLFISDDKTILQALDEAEMMNMLYSGTRSFFLVNAGGIEWAKGLLKTGRQYGIIVIHLDGPGVLEDLSEILAEIDPLTPIGIVSFQVDRLKGNLSALQSTYPNLRYAALPVVLPLAYRGAEAWRDDSLIGAKIDLPKNDPIVSLLRDLHQLAKNRSAGLEEMDAEEFVRRYPQQAANVPNGASRIVVVPDGAVTFYRPETLAGGLEEVVASEQNQFPGLQIDQKPLPASAIEVRPLAVIVWDKMLGNLPYASPVPVVEHQLGQPFPYRLPQLVAMAVLGRKDDTFYLLSAWTFEHKGRQVLALAVLA